MSTLDRTLRKQLADTIGAARQNAKEAASDAIRRLGVAEDEAPTYLTPEDRALRVRLRAHARTLGDGWSGEKKRLLTTNHLEDEATYEIWHRMLFGRFLVERGLLIHPDLGEPIDPKELTDLARDEGLSDPWALVERFAAPSLPAVFKPDDPVLAMTLDPALAKRLRDLVAALPSDVFTADDSLGWTYQFWRTAEKDAVNKAGGKIGAAELPAVTQLFTEPYMVKFLLHNTLGAWWAGKVLTADPNLGRDATDEQSLRDACALAGVTWDYLRFVRETDDGPWRPAAGTFLGWPSRAAEITYCDPCCGSGHFLVEAFVILAALRQHEEGLSGENAARAVLRDNLHGLELDGRCVQIAAFNVALAAWKVAGGPVGLPQPHIAWVGAPPPLSRSEMAALANGDATLRGALVSLHDQYAQAPLLGTLLEVGARDLLDTDLRERGEAALMKLRGEVPERAEGAVAARGLLDATALLGRHYVLLATNVPFLGRGKQDPALATFIEQHMEDAKADLATAMLSRVQKLVTSAGALGMVSPQTWLFLRTYRNLRETMMGLLGWQIVVRLGAGAFQEISGEQVQPVLLIFSNKKDQDVCQTIDLAAEPGRSELSASEKDDSLRGIPPNVMPDARGEIVAINLLEISRTRDKTFTFKTKGDTRMLSSVAQAFVGIQSGDAPRWIFRFWEVLRVPSTTFRFIQMAPDRKNFISGCTSIFRWGDEQTLRASTGARIQGFEALGKKG